MISDDLLKDIVKYRLDLTVKKFYFYSASLVNYKITQKSLLANQ